MLFRICAKHNLHLQAEPTYGGRDYMEKQDFIIEKQKEKISAQSEILTGNDKAIAEQGEKIQKAEKAISEREKVIEKQDILIAEKDAAIMVKHSELEAVTMRLADMEAVADEVAEQAYEKACEVVADTVRQETQREDIRILDEYAGWLSAPERSDDKKLRDYAVRKLGKLKEKFMKSAKGIMQKVTESLHEPERKKENLGEVKERTRVSLKEKLKSKQKNADEYNSQRSLNQTKQAGKDNQSL